MTDLKLTVADDAKDQEPHAWAYCERDFPEEGALGGPFKTMGEAIEHAVRQQISEDIQLLPLTEEEAQKMSGQAVFQDDALDLLHKAVALNAVAGAHEQWSRWFRRARRLIRQSEAETMSEAARADADDGWTDEQNRAYAAGYRDFAERVCAAMGHRFEGGYRHVLTDVSERHGALLALRGAESERTALRNALVKVVDDLVLYHPDADCLQEARALLEGAGSDG